MKKMKSRMLKQQVEEEEEGALSLHEKLKKTSLTVVSLDAALKAKASEAREIQAKNAGAEFVCFNKAVLHDAYMQKV